MNENTNGSSARVSAGESSDRAAGEEAGEWLGKVGELILHSEFSRHIVASEAAWGESQARAVEKLCSDPAMVLIPGEDLADRVRSNASVMKVRSSEEWRGSVLTEKKL